MAIEKIDYANAIPVETYEPEYAQYSDEDIITQLHNFSEQPVTVQPKYDNRNFPGRSKPSDMKAIAKMAVAGPMGLMSKPEDISLNTIFELSRDVFDIMSRPGKGIWGAIDGAMEASEKPFRTNAHGVAKAVSLLGMPVNAVIHSAQGFIEGLSGWRGAAEVLHRVGVKNAKEKLSPEAYAKQEEEFAQKLEKKGFIGKVASSVVHEALHNPLDFFPSIVEDPFVLAGAIPKAGAKSALKAGELLTEKGVLASVKMGERMGTYLKSKMGDKVYNEFLGVVRQAREKGGKGVEGLLEGINSGSAELQSSFKQLWKSKNNPLYKEKQYDQVINPKLGPQVMSEKALFEEWNKKLPAITDKAGNQKAFDLAKQGRYQEATNELLKSRQSAYLKNLEENSLESALATYATYPKGKTLGEVPFWVRDRIHEGLSRFGPVKENISRDFTLESVLKRLPKSIGAITRPQEALKSILADTEMAQLLSKDFASTTVDDVNKMMDKMSTFIPREQIGKAFQDAGINTFGRNASWLNNPVGWARMNWTKWVYDEAGLSKDFFDPRLQATLAENTAKGQSRQNVWNALKDLNGGKEYLTIPKETRERLSLYLNTKDVTLLKNEKELRAAEGLMKERERLWGLLNKDAARRGETIGYIDNYIPYVLEKNAAIFGEESVMRSSEIPIGFKHLKERTKFNPTMEGLEKDVVTLMDSYINGAHRLLYRRDTYETLSKKLGQMNISPEFKKYIIEDMNNWVGQPIKDPMADALVSGFMKTPIAKWMGITEDTAREKVLTASYNLLQWGYASGMGLNFKLPLRNFFQNTLGLSRTSFDSYVDGLKLSTKALLPQKMGMALDPEVNAFKRIVEQSELISQRMGNFEKMMPDVGHQSIYKTPLQALTEKAINVTGFSISERSNVASSFAMGLYEEMRKHGIKSMEALNAHSQKAKIIKSAEKLMMDTQFVYEKMMRPVWMNNSIGSHIIQFGSFGGNMGNLALRDMRPSQRDYLVKSILQQSLLAMTMTAGGLSGAGYAPYFGAIDPIKQLYQAGTEDAAKGIKSPALKAAFGAGQFATGAITGQKKIQNRGFNTLKKAGTPAFYNISKEAMAYKDPSRLFLYKDYGKKKKY